MTTSASVIPTVVMTPIVVAVIFVITARSRASRQGTAFPMRRAVLVVVVAGGAGALVAALAALALTGLVSS